MKRIILAVVLFTTFQFVYSQDDKNETVTDKSTSSKTKRVKGAFMENSYYKKGFLGITEVGSALIFTEGFRVPYFSFNQVLASRVSQKFSIGMGFGVEYGRVGLLSLPVTLDMRVYFIKKRITPILYIAPGYQFFSSTNGFKNGIHTVVANIGPGVDFKINENVGVSAVTGYRLMDAVPQKGFSNDIANYWFFRVGVNY
ncbi:MAG: hypothetical protein U0T69_01200 [Chitinophagales bacterium]